jgi:PPK2 family polyphosphate:nucleotide phosphotransferase
LDEELTKVMKRLMVGPGTKVRPASMETSWDDADDLELNGQALKKENSKGILEESVKRLNSAQGLLWAGDSYSLLIILQGMDASGKDGIIEHVMSGINPQFCHVTSFKAPSSEELDHDFIWRCYKALPERGRIGIFNRSYYEEVLVVKVHPQWLDKQRLPPGEKDDAFWNSRYRSINEIEQHLVHNGTKVLKFFMNISKQEQRQQLMERIDTPEKQWKFNPADVDERASWDEYMKAYADMLQNTSTVHAPWYVVPADQKWLARALVAAVIAETIGSLDLRYPEMNDAQRKKMEESKVKLLTEKD